MEKKKRRRRKPNLNGSVRRKKDVKLKETRCRGTVTNISYIGPKVSKSTGTILGTLLENRPNVKQCLTERAGNYSMTRRDFSVERVDVLLYRMNDEKF